MKQYPGFLKILKNVRQNFWICATLLLGGCASLSLFSSPAQERGMSGFFNDNMLRLKLDNILTEEKGIVRVEVMIHCARVLLAGSVQDEQTKKRLVMRVKKMPGVKDVIDELFIAKAAFSDYASDTWLSQKLQARLFFDTRILSQNYHICVVNKVVYIMGTAQDKVELNWVIEHAEGLPIRHVVQHVMMAPPPKTQP